MGMAATTGGRIRWEMIQNRISPLPRWRLKCRLTARFLRDRLPGVAVPDEVVTRLERAGPDAEAEGVRIAVETVGRIRAIPGVAGIHVMGLGHLDSVRSVVDAAGLWPRPPAA